MIQMSIIMVPKSQSEGLYCKCFNSYKKHSSGMIGERKPSCSGLRSVREPSSQLKQEMGDVLGEEIGIRE